MRLRRVAMVLVELVTLAASLAGNGPVSESLRAAAVIAGAVLGAVVVFVAAVLAVGILHQRQPPYPM